MTDRTSGQPASQGTPTTEKPKVANGSVDLKMWSDAGWESIRESASQQAAQQLTVQKKK